MGLEQAGLRGEAVEGRGLGHGDSFGSKSRPSADEYPHPDPDLRSKLIPRCWGLVAFLPRLPGEETKERWVGVQALGLSGCVLQISALFCIVPTCASFKAQQQSRGSPRVFAPVPPPCVQLPSSLLLTGTAAPSPRAVT